MWEKGLDKILNKKLNKILNWGKANVIIINKYPRIIDEILIKIIEKVNKKVEKSPRKIWILKSLIIQIFLIFIKIKFKFL